jgi:hypothetical protein
MSIKSLLFAAVFLFGVTGVCLAQSSPSPWTPAPRHAPEIDPASASAALALLAGGMLVIRGRRR